MCAQARANFARNNALIQNCKGFGAGHAGILRPRVRPAARPGKRADKELD